MNDSSVRDISISRVLFFVAAGFLCCWIPMWALALWMRFSPETCPRVVQLIDVFLSYLSASVNPLIYTFTNSEFRREFRKLLRCRNERAWNASNKAISAGDKDDGLLDRWNKRRDVLGFPAVWNIILFAKAWVDFFIAVVITEASVCIALSITSIVGNGLVCIATYRNPNLRSTFNLYTIALAVSDLLCATVDMPLASATLIIGRWDFGDAVCQIQGFGDVFTFNVTPATLGLTAFNRYMKIVKTNHYNKIFSTRKSKMWLICLWLTFALYLIIARFTNWLQIKFVQSYAVCAFDFPTSESLIVHYCITVGLLFILPLFIGIFSYYKIYLKTHEHQQKQTLVECYCSWLRDFCVAGYQCGHLFSGFVFLPKLAQELQPCYQCFAFIWVLQ